MSRRLRLILLLLGSLLLVTGLVAVTAVYLLLQPDRFTAMLQSQVRDAGLELSLASPASPTLFPRPALELSGITLNARGANAPILLASRGRLALPWQTVFGGAPVITRLEIDSPRVDLDALQDWLTALPAQPAGTPPNIPRIDTGISISRGSVVSGERLLLGNVALEAGSLISGQPFPVSVSATTAANTPLQLRLSATPRIQGNTLELDNIELHLSQGSAMTLALNGSAHWHGAADASASLAGKLDHADAGQYDISLKLTPADQDNPLLLALKLDGPDNHADMRLPPLELAHWWSQLGDEQGPQLTVPPGSGHAEISRLETDGIRIEGLTLQAGDDVPASASSTAAARPAASKKP
ncbi:membrane assembly protein AsmA [Rhodanobacter sp. B04]|uniref:AsmA family protein n=1 Tax=Rhodanobacter sp. B04 TaxID=1945860 RepID=UPI00098465DB|nr:AsmA family protein [Rhodanobacter sp. B04]OOG66049.1 membrane assembly protein AsmA [Rhodanobacter sp. B04]